MSASCSSQAVRRRRLLAKRRLRQAQQWVAAGHLSRAVAYLRQAVRLDPHFYQADYQLALLLEKDSPPQAIRHYERVRTHQPRFPEPLLKLAGLYENQRRYVAASKAYAAYLRLKPEEAPVYLCFAQLLAELEQFQAAAHLCLYALKLAPTEISTYFQLADMLTQLGYLDYTLEVYMGLIRLYPEMLGLTSMLMGFALEKSGLFETACHCYDQAIQALHCLPIWKLKRQITYPYMLDSAAEIEQIHQCIFKAMSDFQALLRWRPIPTQDRIYQFYFMIHANIVYLSYHHLNPLQLRIKFAELIPELLPRIEVPPLAPRCDGPIHIGLVTKSKSLNMTFVYMGALLNQLDAQRYRITVFCSSTEGQALFDRKNLRYFTHPQAQFKLISYQAPVAAAQIHAENLDLLILTEPAWDPLQSILGGLRLARFQATSIMNPGSSGLPEMDFFLSSALIERPDADQDYSETLVRFRTMPCWIPAQPLSEQPVSRADYGLASLQRIYACPHNLQKFHPDFDTLLADILRADPEGHVVLVARKSQTGLCERLQERFRRAIPDVRTRIWILPELSEREFAGLLRVSDVVLDSLYYSGGNVSYQALFYGIPVITLPTAYMTGRITAALYRQLNLPELIASDREDYIRKALLWASDPELRQRHLDPVKIRRILRQDPEIVAEFSAWLDSLFVSQRG